MRRQKRRPVVSLAIIFILILLFIWQLPALLRTIPSRYLFRAPDFIQEIARGEQNPILPTAAAPSDAAALLAPTTIPTSLPTPVVRATGGPPATPTPIPTSTPIPTATTPPIPIIGNARLEGIYHQFQDWNNCGPATLAMTLSYFGLAPNQTETAAILKPSQEDRNVSPNEMAAYVNTQTDIRAIDRVNGNLDTLRRLLDAGFPVIIEIGLDPPGEYAWLEWYGHYLLVVAYDDAQGQIWVYDSWFGTSEVPLENKHSFGRIVTYENLENYWAQFNRTYITLYSQEQESTLQAIIGAEWDDTLMWQNALVRSQNEATNTPENAFYWFNMGTAYNHLGDYVRAAAAYDQARAIGLPWRMLWYQFGPYEAYYQMGRYEDVITLTNATLQTYDYFEEALYYRGIAEQALGDLISARTDLEKAAAFNPQFTPAVEALAQLN
ncbi:MAG: C39 family peptidase [Chloroflexi bacterium]|nr:C39 family peptidase [Chloroflexota bacterium]MBP8057616.1 C39 family peptidase [Chloroflexota bacterium]